MTAAVAQLVSSLTGAVTLTVSEGSTLHVMGVGFFADFSAVTCSDDQGGGTAAYGPSLDCLANGGNSTGQFRKGNLHAGSVTVTLGNIPGGGGTGMLAVVELTGVSAAPNDVHTSHFQTDPGNGGTATSGNITPSNSPGIIIGFCAATNLGFDGTDASVGPGFINVGTCLKCFGTNDAFRVEYKLVTSTSPVSADFIWAGFGNDSIAYAAVYDEPPSGVVIVPAPPLARVLMGIPF